MRDQVAWSISLGRWFGISVRLHMFFLLFAAITFYFVWSVAQSLEGNKPGYEIATLSLGLLALSLIVHGVGHALAAYRLGGRMESVILVPWGGVDSVHLYGGWRQLVYSAAGPAANLIVCLVCGAVLILRERHMGFLVGLMNPFFPSQLIEGHWVAQSLKLSFWINWLLVLVNLIPSVPFDGGQMTRSILQMIWTKADEGQIRSKAATVAQAAGILFFVGALFTFNQSTLAGVPVWLTLVLLGIVILFTSRHSAMGAKMDESQQYEVLQYEASDEELHRHSIHSWEDDEDEFDYDDESVSQWLEQRKQQREELRRQEEQEEEVRVDEILARVHRDGLSSLSDEDRQILNRVSARYRSRKGEQAPRNSGRAF